MEFFTVFPLLERFSGKKETSVAFAEWFDSVGVARFI